ncbi:hypothetical protein L0669_03445 [Flavobacterium bizetiae]|uniref:hypothetical protein n=1 Tax=Flavobacterium bizetiae TaxID=2704140 RepID=UPI0021E976EC|nr:hypothetical protein [Flavobacterium bizetiae]UTN04960.1 hypothetical protein L0669_03445 [Flavobacterium bizetiae]
MNIYSDKMNELIIESKGIKTDHYFIPPFELRKGELVIIYLEGGAHFDDLKEQLVSIFSGKANHENVKVIKPLTFAAPIEESALKRIFNPMSVGGYLKRNANLKNSVSRIFEVDNFTKKDKVKKLDTSERKRLSLCAVFSKTKYVSFDLRGEAAAYFNKTYQFAKDEIKNDNAAILIDWSNELKNDCSRFVTIEWLADSEELKKVFSNGGKLSPMY